MGALDGILVIALEQAVAAPLCTVRLADAGARVIKIERAGGETARHYDATVHGTSAYFAWLNRGKESAVLDLKSADDMALFREMLGRADVLVQNLAPGALDRLGLSPDVISQAFPRLIAVSVVGYGQDTPYAQMKAYDLLVQAESGLCAVTGTGDDPCKVGASVTDIGTGMNAHAAVLEALIERARTGRGCSIEVAMFDGMADWMTVPLLHHDYAGKDTARHGMRHASVYPYRPFDCADGTILIAVQTNAEWENLCAIALDMPGLATRPDFASNALRVQNRVALDVALEPAFARHSVAEMIARLDHAAIAWAQYRTVGGLSDHEALRRITVPLPGGQTAEIPRPAGRGNDFAPGPVPELGAETDAIRREFDPH